MDTEKRDPIQADTRIKKGCVAVTQRGTLYLVLGKFFRKTDKTPNGWHGIGFNGKRVQCDYPEFVALNINSYITKTHMDMGA
jgi:hypothetical protein